MYTCNGILFNHESPLRGETFVTRKITRGAAKISLGMQEKIYLGNLDAQRDWGHAKDYVEGMWLMMQQEVADDYVLATGETHSVKKFCELAFGEVGIELEWQGEAENEKGINKKTGKVIIEVDPKYFRPTEVELLIGDPSKAHRELGWKHKYSLNQLVSEMMKADVELFSRDQYLQAGGHKVMNYNE
jgi:GDPmannose 4,6-dehydratase